MCKTIKEYIRGNSEASTTKNTQGMQKVCGCGKFSQYVLSRFAKTTKTHI